MEDLKPIELTGTKRKAIARALAAYDPRHPIEWEHILMLANRHQSSPTDVSSVARQNGFAVAAPPEPKAKQKPEPVLTVVPKAPERPGWLTASVEAALRRGFGAKLLDPDDPETVVIAPVDQWLREREAIRKLLDHALTGPGKT